MQRVIELGRVIRERQNRPLKAPLARLVVVAADREFLADIEGAPLLLIWIGGPLHLDCPRPLPPLSSQLAPGLLFFAPFLSSSTRLLITLPPQRSPLNHHAFTIHQPLHQPHQPPPSTPGELREYVESELNVRCLETCADPLAYAVLRAEPEWAVLGRRLGKDMGKVAAGVKALTADELMRFEKEGAISVAGYDLGPGDLKVLHDFKPPEGAAAGDADAAGDGEVLVVLDLRSDPALIEAGMARELVNRYQRLRKKAGLTVTDAVELYFEQLPASASVASLASVSAAGGAAADGGGSGGNGGGGEGGEAAAAALSVAALVERQADYLKESLGLLPRPLAGKPPASAVLAREETNIGGEQGAVFAAVLAAPEGSALAAAAAAGKVAALSV